MLTPDTDARRRAVPRCARACSGTVALERWGHGLRRIRLLHLRPDSHDAPRRIGPVYPTTLVRTEEKR